MLAAMAIAVLKDIFLKAHQYRKGNEWALAAAVSVLLLLCVVQGPVYRLISGKAAHNIKRSVVCVTGCDSGFGLYMARKMKSLGYIVCATCLTEAGAAVLDKEGIYTVVVDLCDEGSYAAVGDAVRASMAVPAHRGCKLWAIINNAGIAPIGFTDWVSLDVFRKAMEVNYFAVVGVTKELLPLLKQSQHSRIINLSSMAGKAATCSFGPYAGSKHAVEGWAKALRYEMGPFDIKVCNVNPGFMNTPLLDTSLQWAQRTLDAADADVRRFYDCETILRGNADSLLRIREPLHTVGDYIVDYLLGAKHPCFNHFVGLQATAGRWYIMLPQVLMELFGSLFTPVVGVNAEAVRMEHSLGAYSSARACKEASAPPASAPPASISASAPASAFPRIRSRSRPRARQ